MDGEIWTVSSATLFEVNSRLHQAIIVCSGNSFFVESLKRIDTLRRLMEYRHLSSVSREKTTVVTPLPGKLNPAGPLSNASAADDHLWPV